MTEPRITMDPGRPEPLPPGLPDTDPLEVASAELEAIAAEADNLKCWEGGGQHNASVVIQEYTNWLQRFAGAQATVARLMVKEAPQTVNIVLPAEDRKRLLDEMLAGSPAPRAAAPDFTAVPGSPLVSEILTELTEAATRVVADDFGGPSENVARFAGAAFEAIMYLADREQGIPGKIATDYQRQAIPGGLLQSMRDAAGFLAQKHTEHGPEHSFAKASIKALESLYEVPVPAATLEHQPAIAPGTLLDLRETANRLSIAAPFADLAQFANLVVDAIAQMAMMPDPEIRS